MKPQGFQIFLCLIILTALCLFIGILFVFQILGFWTVPCIILAFLIFCLLGGYTFARWSRYD